MGHASRSRRPPPGSSARLSRAAGRGGGTTLPGKLLWKLDPGRHRRARPPRSRAASRSSRRRTARRRRPRWPAAILGRRDRLAWNHSGANLASGVASTLLGAADAELGLLEVDEFALPEVHAPDAAARRRRSGTSFATSSTATASSSTSPSAGAPRSRELARRRRRSSSNADDPLVARSPTAASDALRFGVDDRARARPALQHAADSKYCVRCGRPYAYDAAYVGHLGDYRCPALRPRAAAARRRRARDRARTASTGSSFSLVDARGSSPRAAPAARPLQRLQRARRSVALRSRSASRSTRSSPGSSGSAPRSAASSASTAGDRRRAPAADQEPRRRERGRAHARGRRRSPPTLVVALNDAIADGRDVSWIWDVDFEPLLEHAETDRRRPASAPPSSRSASRTRASRASGSRWSPTSRRRSTAGSSSRRPGGELAVLPTYTAMLELRAIAHRARPRAPYWEETAA